MTNNQLLGKRILVVDDEKEIRESVSEILIEEGLFVESARNGVEALEKVSEGNFDLILSDIRMPGGDGITFLKNMKKTNSTPPPLVFMTAFFEASVKDALDAGAVGIIQKPFSIRLLFEKLENAISMAI